MWCEAIFSETGTEAVVEDEPVLSWEERTTALEGKGGVATYQNHMS